MDLIDKQIILELFGNCRVTYRSLSKKLGLSSTSTRKRVLKLRETGLVSRGYVLLSLAMLDAEHCYARITTDGTEKDDDFFDRMGKNAVILDMIRTDQHSLIVHAEVIGSLGLYKFGKFIRSFESVIDADINFMHPVTPTQLPDHHQYVYLGEKVALTKQHLTVLNHLWHDARVPATEIAKVTKYSASRVQQIIRELQSNRGLYFTIFTNFSAAGIVPFLIGMEYDERKITPQGIVKWIQDRYPFEYWNSWQVATSPRLYLFCTAPDIKSIDRITKQVKDAPFANQVGTEIFRPQNHHVGPGHVRLGELLGIEVMNHRVQFYNTDKNQFY